MRQGMSSPSAAAALVLLLALLAGGQCREAQLDAADAGTGTENYTASDAAVYWGPWQRARATWYGQPNGAGPDDNGGACGFKDTNHRMQPPFSIRIRNESGKTLVANNVIPANWRPNTFYRSFVQYSWLAGALLGSVTIVYSTILCSTTTRLLLLLLVYYHQVRRNGTASRRRRPWEGRCLRSP
ncbi:beta expansin8, partial [Zea mays]